MWTRSELKIAAKDVLHRTYWVSVLVSLIFSIVGGGFRFNYTRGYSRNNHNYNRNYSNDSGTVVQQALMEAAKNGEITQEEFETYFKSENTDELPQAVKDEISRLSDKTNPFENIDINVILPFILFGLVVFLVIFTMTMVLSAFVFMPLQVGCYRYFVRARDEEGKIEDVVCAFKENYKNIVWIMFVRSMKILGWTCLLIIPGIIKSYEYSMIPYLLAENPDMTSEEAFETTRRMTDGNKWDMFVLGLSFIGWVILGLLTCGLGLIFYVNPYVQITMAELYHKLKEINGISPISEPAPETL